MTMSMAMTMTMKLTMTMTLSMTMTTTTTTTTIKANKTLTRLGPYAVGGGDRGFPDGGKRRQGKHRLRPAHSVPRPLLLHGRGRRRPRLGDPR